MHRENVVNLRIALDGLGGHIDHVSITERIFISLQNTGFNLFILKPHLHGKRRNALDDSLVADGAFCIVPHLVEIEQNVAVDACNRLLQGGDFPTGGVLNGIGLDGVHVKVLMHVAADNGMTIDLRCCVLGDRLHKGDDVFIILLFQFQLRACPGKEVAADPRHKLSEFQHGDRVLDKRQRQGGKGDQIDNDAAVAHLPDVELGITNYSLRFMVPGIPAVFVSQGQKSVGKVKQGDGLFVMQADSESGFVLHGGLHNGGDFRRCFRESFDVASRFLPEGAAIVKKK